MYERDIRIHTIVMSHGTGKVIYNEKKISKTCKNNFLPEIRTFGRKYFQTLQSDNCSSCSYKQFCPKFNQHATTMQTESNQEVTKMTDKHAAEFSKTAC